MADEFMNSLILSPRSVLSRPTKFEERFAVTDDSTVIHNECSRRHIDNNDPFNKRVSSIASPPDVESNRVKNACEVPLDNVESECSVDKEFTSSEIKQK